MGDLSDRWKNEYQCRRGPDVFFNTLCHSTLTSYTLSASNPVHPTPSHNSTRSIKKITASTKIFSERGWRCLGHEPVVSYNFLQGVPLSRVPADHPLQQLLQLLHTLLTLETLPVELLSVAVPKGGKVVALQVFEERVLVGSKLKGQLPKNKSEQHDTQREHVGSFGAVTLTLLEGSVDLRSHVAPLGALDSPHQLLLAVHLRVIGEPKISYFELVLILLLKHQNVLQLQIPVRYVVGVEVLHALTDLLEDVPAVLEGQFVFFDKVQEAAVGGILRDQNVVVLPLEGDARPEEKRINYILMVNLGQKSILVEQVFRLLPVRSRDHLQCQAVLAVRILKAIDGAVGAFAQLRQLPRCQLHSSYNYYRPPYDCSLKLGIYG